MDLELSAEQQDLRDQFRKLLSAYCDHDTRRAAMSRPGAVDRDLWRRLSETGVFSLRLPANAGGSGAGVVEAVVVHEEIGRAAVPGPVVASALLAPVLYDLGLGGVAEGTVVVTAVYGTDRVVEHLDGADLVAFLSPSGLRTVSPDQLVSKEAGVPLDPLTPVQRIDGPVDLGDSLVGPADAADLWAQGTLLSAASHVGVAAAAIDMATAYAKQRTQFNRPIGGFQAVKHLLAGALAATEVARAAVQCAAVHLDEAAPAREVGRAVAGARVLASRAALRSTRACIQVHGGMGFTWDLDAHLYFKRALVLDTHFDPPAAAREQLLARLGGPAGLAEPPDSRFERIGDES